MSASDPLRPSQRLPRRCALVEGHDTSERRFDRSEQQEKALALTGPMAGSLFRSCGSRSLRGHRESKPPRESPAQMASKVTRVDEVIG